MRLARLCLPAMKRANWGRIIFISSESALQIPSEMIHYGMTKMAQLAVSRGLAEAVAGTGITVAPDFTDQALCFNGRSCGNGHLHLQSAGFRDHGRGPAC